MGDTWRVKRRRPSSAHRTRARRCDCNTRRNAPLGPCRPEFDRLPRSPLLLCAAANVGSHAAPFSASTQRMVVAASRTSQPCVLAQSCKRSQPILGFSGSSSLALTANSTAADLSGAESPFIRVEPAQEAQCRCRRKRIRIPPRAREFAPPPPATFDICPREAKLSVRARRHVRTPGPNAAETSANNTCRHRLITWCEDPRR